EQALEEVVERHVVVARHDEDCPGQRVEKTARVAELRRLRALREIARHHDHLRCERVHLPGERRKKPRVDAPEMQVREMHQRSQGPMTRSARALMRYSSGRS